jgi:hypothetical protein
MHRWAAAAWVQVFARVPLQETEETYSQGHFPDPLDSMGRLTLETFE